MFLFISLKEWVEVGCRAICPSQAPTLSLSLVWTHTHVHTHTYTRSPCEVSNCSSVVFDQRRFYNSVGSVLLCHNMQAVIAHAEVVLSSTIPPSFLPWPSTRPSFWTQHTWRCSLKTPKYSPLTVGKSAGLHSQWLACELGRCQWQQGIMFPSSKLMACNFFYSHLSFYDTRPEVNWLRPMSSFHVASKKKKAEWFSAVWFQLLIGMVTVRMEPFYFFYFLSFQS